MDEPERIVVVGGGAAGLAVAESARSAGFAGRLIMVGRERHLPYDRPPLSKQVLAGAWPAERVQLRDAARLGALGLEIRTGEPVVGLDSDAFELVLAGGERVPYDRLAVTTGVDPRMLPDTAGVEGMHVLRDLDHTLRLRAVLRPGTRMVVIGAGVLGSEVAAVAAGAGRAPTATSTTSAVELAGGGHDAGQRSRREVDQRDRDLVAGLHHEHGVELRLATAVAGSRDPWRVTGW